MATGKKYICIFYLGVNCPFKNQLKCRTHKLTTLNVFGQVLSCRDRFFFCHSYVFRSQVLWVQPGTRTSPSHGDRTPQPGTDTAGHRKHRRTQEGRLGSRRTHAGTHSHFTLVFKAPLFARFIPLQFPLSCTHLRLSHLAPLQPGSHSQRPVTWWQLVLWTQSQLCSQPSPKNPLEQASDETRKAFSIQHYSPRTKCL